MSSKYTNSFGTFNDLQNDDISQGAGTNSSGREFIMAKFPYAVIVSKITLASPGMTG